MKVIMEKFENDKLVLKVAFDDKAKLVRIASIDNNGSMNTNWFSAQEIKDIAKELVQ
tara:strand:- start:36 stop:206 length:171 start_codon:yes stop_codon:yes gene_type:complete